MIALAAGIKYSLNEYKIMNWNFSFNIRKIGFELHKNFLLYLPFNRNMEANEFTKK